MISFVPAWCQRSTHEAEASEGAGAIGLRLGSVPGIHAVYSMPALSASMGRVWAASGGGAGLEPGWRGRKAGFGGAQGRVAGVGAAARGVEEAASGVEAAARRVEAGVSGVEAGAGLFGMAGGGARTAGFG